MLEVNKLQVIYPNGNEALKSISLRAEPGEIIAVIGRSGAGKSTLLRCINGLQPVTSGEVILDNKCITRMGQKQLRLARREIGFIWQEYNLIDRLPVITNVLTGRLGYTNGIGSLVGYFARGHREIALKSLDRVNTVHRANFRADRLSGGEKQRVSIARAIAQGVIIYDGTPETLDAEIMNRIYRFDNDLNTIGSPAPEPNEFVTAPAMVI